MKLDLELLRWILLEVEAAPAGYPVVLLRPKYPPQYGGPHSVLEIGEHDYLEVYEHVLLLGEEGESQFLEIQKYPMATDGNGPLGAKIIRMTRAGHDFLGASRNESIWKKAMTVVIEKGGGAITIGAMTQLLGAFLRLQLGLP